MGLISTGIDFVNLSRIRNLAISKDFKKDETALSFLVENKI